jgi:YfiH family protein
MTAIDDDALQRCAGVRHVFFTRIGGVSDGIYASLNCGFGSGDQPEHVYENRTRAAAQLSVGADRLLSLHQVHGREVIAVESPWSTEAGGVRPKADAMVTDRPGIALGILSADCAPVLLADAEARVIGAAHAGWRGALVGVIEATIAAMVRLGARAERVAARVGPAIGPDSYEVGPEFPAPFLAADAASTRFFRPAPRAGHFLFDLPGYCLSRLVASGIAAASCSRDDTCRDEQRYFSYRRNTLAGVRDYGRGLSAIVIET